jgi:hypothetical protein
VEFLAPETADKIEIVPASTLNEVHHFISQLFQNHQKIDEFWMARYEPNATR